ncbi:MAG: DUF697 domain-containing protein [Pseudomonadota bacterium]
MPKALVIIAFFLTLGIITFIGGQILTLSEFAAVLHPVLGSVIFALGASVFGLTILWLAFRYFMRPKALILRENPSDEDIENYAKALVSRLKSSPHMQAYAAKKAQAHQNADSETNLEHNAQASQDQNEIAHILSYLDDEAMKETRRTASRIFLATAISRNGRLDTLIVLALLIRLVWRVSHIYNQRPHPRHILQLYVNVAGTALAAGALEDVGLEEHIHALLTPMLAAGPVSSVPTMSGVGTMLGTALVDGSANALLALRVGIVTRNMLSPTLPHMQERSNPYTEAAKILGKMSRGLVSKVVKTAMHAISHGVKNSACNVAKSAYTSTKNAAQGVVNGVAATFSDASKVSAKMADDSVAYAEDITVHMTEKATDMANHISKHASYVGEQASCMAETVAENISGNTPQNTITYADNITSNGTVMKSSLFGSMPLSSIRLPKLSLFSKKK